ncbi:MAG TPA: ROK family protein [Planctomycetota bacterium]|nr:ROK family protein [Planctomycetota bacterium]
MDQVIAVDLGGTNIRAARVDADGKILVRDKVSTRASEGMTAVMGRIAELVNTLKTPAVKAVGLGTPGVPDPHTGRMRLPAVNLPGSDDFPLGEQLAAKTSLIAACDNDGNLAALGESWLGAGRGEPVVIIFTLGTGIGGGLVNDGKVYHGHHNLGTEFGHVSIDYDGRQCGCGGRGCVERYASASALGRDAREFLACAAPIVRETSLWKKCGGRAGLESVDARMVCDAAREGDEVALFLLDRCCRWLACGVGAMINALNPSCVIIGGGMSASSDLILPRVERELKMGRAFGPIGDDTKLRAGTLGDDAGLLGAAKLALQKL